MQSKLLGIICVDFEARGQLLITYQYSAFVEYHQESSGKPGWLEIKWYTAAFGSC
jgi:hypothetical protein